MSNKNTARHNNLSEARRRAGLEAKQICFLLGKKHSEELYRYENGLYFPHLITLFKLAVILDVPPHFLYQKLFAQIKAEIDEKRKRHPALFPERAWSARSSEQLKHSEQCFYAGILKHHSPTGLELIEVNKHIISMMNTISDYKQGRSPFAL